MSAHKQPPRTTRRLSPFNAFERLARLWARYPPGTKIPEEYLDAARAVYRAVGIPREPAATPPPNEPMH